MQRQLRARAQDHEEFYKQLSVSEDGFGKVAEYFGKGIFFDDDDPDVLETPGSERGPLGDAGGPPVGGAARDAAAVRRPARGIGPAY